VKKEFTRLVGADSHAHQGEAVGGAPALTL
jgi:hypothetical protein